MPTRQPITPKTISRPLSAQTNSTRRSLLIASVTLNGVFIAGLIALGVMCHMRSYWFAIRVHNVYSRVCPTTVSDRMTTKQSGDIATSTYFIGSAALESGCADPLLSQAQLDNYRANPDIAKADADTLRKLVPNHVLNVTIVKSSENNVQLSPLQMVR